MGLTCGIVGLPNVGKSTLFNALTNSAIEAANYPFCTIEPHTGVVRVPDQRLDALAKIINPQKVIPTTLSFIDIAGLVKGASQGEGLGNQFLANIRQADAIIHVVRCFEHQDIIHVEGRVDPCNDVSIIETELLLADLASVDSAIQKLKKVAKSGNTVAIKQLNLLEELSQHLSNGNLAKTWLAGLDSAILCDWIELGLNLLTAKPLLYVANVDAESFKHGNKHLHNLQELALTQHTDVVVVCADIEAELGSLSPEEQQLFLADLGCSQPSLHRLIQASYKLLSLETFFTAGVKEVRAWTFARNSTAPEAAGKIHSDFAKGFIRAEVIAYADYISYRGEQGAKDAGKWRLEGKQYIVQDGDVIYFRFNV